MFRFYGKDGVRTPLTPHADPGEMGVVIECLAPTADRALEVLKTAKQYLLHFGFPGHKSTAGNLAFPFTPPEVDTGEVYELTAFHLMETDDPAAYSRSGWSRSERDVPVRRRLADVARPGLGSGFLKGFHVRLVPSSERSAMEASGGSIR